MRIFITGGTGLVGGAVLRAAVEAGHIVTALARSAAGTAQIRAAGARALAGDLSDPVAANWVARAVEHDVIIHCAATFKPDMGAVDRRAMAALIAAAAGRSDGVGRGDRIRLVYTGGVWLYGATAQADERSQRQPLAAYRWMEENTAMLCASGAFDMAVLHPGIVYGDGGGGGFARMAETARAGREIEIWGAETIRWPLVHCCDLAQAYLLLAERADLTGDYNAVTEAGVPVARIARAISERLGTGMGTELRDRAAVLARHGAAALGPMLSQVISGARLRALGWQPQHEDFRDSL